MTLPEPVPPPLADDMSIDREQFRMAFRRHAASVVVVTYIDSTGAPRGMTATAMCALSVDPPSLIVCIDRATRTHEEVMRHRTFAIDILAAHQRRIGVHCARPGADKRLHDAWLAPDTAPGDPPHIVDSVAHLVCTIDSALDAFTHTVVVGRVRSIVLDPLDPEPLLYRAGQYTRLQPDLGLDVLPVAPVILPDPVAEDA